MILFIWHSRIGKSMVARNRKWLVGGGGVVRRLTRDKGTFWSFRNILYLVSGGGTQIYATINTHQTEHFIPYKLSPSPHSPSLLRIPEEILEGKKKGEGCSKSSKFPFQYPLTLSS